MHQEKSTYLFYNKSIVDANHTFKSFFILMDFLRQNLNIIACPSSAAVLVEPAWSNTEDRFSCDGAFIKKHCTKAKLRNTCV